MASSALGSVWYLDSGASFHMTRDKESFIDLEEKDLRMHIEMGDDGRYSATGIGTITFERDSGKPFQLKNVMHVPGLKKNLVSVAMLEDRGYDVVFSSGKSYLRHKATGQVKKIGIRVKNLYMLEVDGCSAMIGKVEKVMSRDEGELWHRRLGHLHHGALKIMQQISTGLPRGTLAQSDQCKGCTLGKYVKSTFHEKENHASVILERIHMDMCGPFSVASTEKHRYYVIFVDDFSHKCWIFFLQKKDQTFSKFCEFKALVEKESGKQVKALRSDNGGEYISNEFKDFCSREGIRRELIAPHNPQQNGVIERKNKMIVGATRAMLHDQGLPMHLWAEACNTMVYV
jgi:transposase InsO family protein